MNKSKLSFQSGVINLNNKITVDGKDKEVKFIEVNETKKVVKIFFKDFTYITFNDVKILQKKDEGF